jgi:Ca-activated chloride channel family protein
MFRSDKQIPAAFFQIFERRSPSFFSVIDPHRSGQAHFIGKSGIQEKVNFLLTEVRKEMKILPSLLIIAVFFITSSPAQSGRRVQAVQPVPTSTPQVQETQDDIKAAKQNDSVGYSESAPNASRSIQPRLSSKDKKTKKETKKDSKEKELPQPATTTSTDPSEDTEVIKVETNLVTIPVSVYDRNGLYVADLQKQDFKIFENGSEQEIAYFGKSDKPFSVVLLIDVSPSTAYKIEEIQAAAAAFVEHLQPPDRVMVIEFDASVHVMTEMTGDREKIYKAIKRTGFGDGTSLYEAVDFSLRKQLEKIEGRKSIVLFTDGVDTASVRASFEGTVRDAEESEAVIFPIYYNTFLNNLGIGGGGGVMSTPPIINMPGTGGQRNGSSSAEYTRGRAYLTELAAATGGKVFRPESTAGGLTAAFESIAEELRSQYSVGYYPTEEGAPGDRKQIRVRVDRPRLLIRSRDSYIVGEK